MPKRWENFEIVEHADGKFSWVVYFHKVDSMGDNEIGVKGTIRFDNKEAAITDAFRYREEQCAKVRSR